MHRRVQSMQTALVSFIDWHSNMAICQVWTTDHRNLFKEVCFFLNTKQHRVFTKKAFKYYRSWILLWSSSSVLFEFLMRSGMILLTYRQNSQAE